MKNKLALYSLCLFLGVTGPIFGKMNPKWASAQPDTLILNPSDMRKYHAAKRIGEDISNVAVFTTIFSVPAFILAMTSPHLFFPDRGDEDRYNLIAEGYFSGVVPVLTIAVAAGNLTYALAAGLDSNGTHPVARIWLPYAVSAASAYSIYRFSKELSGNCYRTRNDGSGKGGCSDMTYPNLIGFSSILTIPLMRHQFSESRFRLNSLEIRPFSEAKSVSAVFGF